MKDIIRKQFDRLRARGAHYVDTRWYPYEDSNFLYMWNGNLKANNASSQSGLGVRVLYNGAWGFSASSDLANPEAIYEKAFDNARIASERVTFPVRLAEKDAIVDSFNSPNEIDPFTIGLDEKVAFLKKMDEALNQPGVVQRTSMVEFVRKQIIFMDSEGSDIEKNIIEVFPRIGVMGFDKDGGMQRLTYMPGRKLPHAVGKALMKLTSSKMLIALWASSINFW